MSALRPLLSELMEDLLEDCLRSQRDTNTNACVAIKEVVDVCNQKQRKLGSSQKTMKHDLKRDILSPTLVPFSFILYQLDE